MATAAPATPTVADRFNNPGNIKDASTGGFKVFATPQEGYAALLNDLQSKITGATSTGLKPTSTLYDFASKYAPSSDKNDPAQYTANLANAMGVRPDTQLHELQPRIGDFAQAIAKAEGYTPAANFQSQPQQNTVPTPVDSNPNNALFRASPNDNPLVAGVKSAANVPGSIINFGKGIFDAVTHPISTLEGIGNAAIGGAQALTGNSNPNDTSTQAFNALAGAFQARYGSLENLQRTATEDPFGFGSDILSVLSGGAGLVGKGAEAASLIGKVGETAAAPIEAAATATGRVAANTAKYAAARATGLQTSTIGEVLGSPSEFTAEAIAQSSRKAIADTVKTALDARTEALADTGSEYSGIRDLQAPNLTTAADDSKVFDLGGGKKLIYNLADAPNDALDLPDLRRKVQLLSNQNTLAGSVRAKVNDFIKLSGNEVSDINVIGSTAAGKINPNDTDILVSLKKKRTPTDSGNINERVAFNKALEQELSGLFPNKVHVTVADYEPARGAKMSLEDFANKQSPELKETKDLLSAREKIETIPHEVKVAKNFIENQFKAAAGIGFKDGQAFSTGASSVRESRDVRAVQNLYDLWKPVFDKGSLTTTEYLNFRSDLAKMAKFERDIGKSSALENLSGIIRAHFNQAYRNQIPGLKTLDDRFSVEKTQLDELSKGLIDRDGNLTDTAINRIARAGGKGKDLLLERLEKLVPGITHKIQVQEAIEDIQKAMSGTQVGAYSKSVLETGGLAGAVAGLSTGNIPLLAGSLAMTILTAPKTAVPLMRMFGFQKELVKNVLGNLKLGISDAGKLNSVAPATALSGAGNTGQEIATALPAQ